MKNKNFWEAEFPKVQCTFFFRSFEILVKAAIMNSIAKLEGTSLSQRLHFVHEESWVCRVTRLPEDRNDKIGLEQMSSVSKYPESRAIPNYDNIQFSSK